MDKNDLPVDHLSKQYQTRRAKKYQTVESDPKAKPNNRNCPSKLHTAVGEILFRGAEEGKYSNIRREVRLHVCGHLFLTVDYVVFNNLRGCDEAHEPKGKESERFDTICQAWEGAGPMDLFVWRGNHAGPLRFKRIKGRP